MNPERAPDSSLHGLPAPADGLMFSTEAEMAILCCCLIDGSDSLLRCQAAGLRYRAFYSVPNGIIYAALQKLREAQGKVDLVMLIEFLRERGKIEAVGGMPYLLRVTAAVPTTLSIQFVIEQVLTLSYRRKAHELLMTGCERVRAPGPWAEAHEELQAIGGKIAMMKIEAGEPMAEAAAGARERLAEMAAGTAPKPNRIVFGIREADEKLLPLDPANEDFLAVIMGQPSHGKSSLARNIVGANLPRDKRIVVFLLETGRKRFLQSEACEAARVNMQKLSEYPRDMIAKMDAEMERVEAWCRDGKLFVYDDVYYVDDIESRCALISEQTGPIDLVVVDYLQQVRTRKKCYNREQEVADISGRLCHLGKKSNAVVLALAQMNREATRDKRMPRLSDLRESGAIGQDAGRVIAIHRPEEDCRGQEQQDNQDTFEQWLVQLKFRNGPTGYVKTWFRKKITRFENMREEKAK